MNMKLIIKNKTNGGNCDYSSL